MISSASPPLSAAMVFAAGEGTRMRPPTEHCPKPMVRVQGRPMLDYHLAMFAAHGTERLVVNTHYKPQAISDYLAAHWKGHSAMRVTEIYEPRRLETGAGLLNALPILGHDPLFCCNADTILLDLPEVPTALQRLQAAWNPALMDALLLLHPMEQALGYDGPPNFTLEGGGEFGPLIQSQAVGTAAVPHYVFTGLQILSPRVLAGYDPTTPFSLSEVFRSRADAKGHLLRIYGLVHRGHWLHIGTPEGLGEAEAFLQKQPVAP